jgi:hypothetical protein
MSEPSREARTSDAPSAEAAAGPTADIAGVARAQRILIASMAILLVAVIVPFVAASTPLLAGAMRILDLVSIVVAVVGAYRMGRALAEKTGVTLLWCAAIVGFVFIDGILSLIVIAILSAKATKVLRKAGLKVGFLGAAA